MRRVGPQPPEPDWDRLDFRGLNGSRQAWGYLSPNDEVIVTNEGDVYVKIERETSYRTKWKRAHRQASSLNQTCSQAHIPLGGHHQTDVCLRRRRARDYSAKFHTEREKIAS